MSFVWWRSYRCMFWPAANRIVDNNIHFSSSWGCLECLSYCVYRSDSIYKSICKLFALCVFEMSRIIDIQGVSLMIEFGIFRRGVPWTFPSQHGRLSVEIGEQMLQFGNGGVWRTNEKNGCFVGVFRDSVEFVCCARDLQLRCSVFAGVVFPIV